MASVLFVCLGNICRSPSAEAVFASLVQQENLAETFKIDSAGTGAWHAGNPPDERAQQVGLALGYDLSQQRARQVMISDFHQFDYVIAMDKSNLQALERMAPPDFSGTLALMLDFAGGKGQEVPDPYYGGLDDYYHVYDLLKPAAKGLLEHIREHQNL